MYPGKGDTLRRGDTPRRGDIQAEEPWRKAGSPGSPGVPDVPVQRGGDTAAGTQVAPGVDLGEKEGQRDVNQGALLSEDCRGRGRTHLLDGSSEGPQDGRGTPAVPLHPRHGGLQGAQRGHKGGTK